MTELHPLTVIIIKTEIDDVFKCETYFGFKGFKGFKTEMYCGS